jgi:hypothetical protein
MFSQPLQLSQWAGPIAGIAVTLLALFAAYVFAGRRKKRRLRTRQGPHSNLPSSLEYEMELTWRG